MKAPKPIQGIKNYVRSRRQPPIQEVVRETSSGGVVFRRNQKTKQLEILLVQDARDRWTLPKGHVEEGETTQETAVREIGEETGIHNVRVLQWLGKTNYRFRRVDSLVLMVTHVYLVKALDESEQLKGEDWMNGIEWVPANKAIELVAYDQLSKLMLIAMKRMRESA
jgi:8-oxo-dGTP pyrophosphatase MutT (NUDIX family)